MTAPPAGPAASPWVVRWSHLVPPGADVLDLACGSGRHARWFAALGHRVTAVDRDADAVGRLAGVAEASRADLEAAPWPLDDRRFGAVVVTNYLWRALLPRVVGAVDAGGVLIYETFGAGQARIGRPSNPDFLLRPGELLDAVRGLHVVAYEDGFLTGPDRCVQRIAAVRETVGAGSPPCRRLDPAPG